MPADSYDHEKAIDSLETCTHYVERSSVPDGPEAVDLVGRVEAVIKRLQSFVRSIKVETPFGVQGSTYVSKEQGGKNVYSFNPSRIIADTMTRLDLGYREALDLLVEEGVFTRDVRNQTAVTKFAHKYDITLVVASHEVEDGDLEAPHIGKVWKEGNTVVVPIADFD